MTLPVTPPIEPMLAEGTDQIPVGDYLYEPKWDGFRTLAFKDGDQIGSMLDRNGLRPAKYVVTKDGLVVLASEFGVLDISADRVTQKGRVQPGKMLLVDTREGRIILDDQIKHQVATPDHRLKNRPNKWGLT